MKDSISMTSYDVFPGITVIYNDICAERVSGRHYEREELNMNLQRAEVMNSDILLREIFL